jgi:Tol biopolymer transport system component
MTVSPDGRHFVFPARNASGKVQLWIQPVDSLSARVIPATDDAFVPFWSPDSRSVAFMTPGKLKRVDINGGPVQDISDAVLGAPGGTWSPEGVILFSPRPNGPLYRVAATGGEPVAVTKLENQGSHRFPWFLPDGRHFLYLATPPGNSGVFVGDLQSGSTKRLLSADSGAAFAPPDFLLFVRQGSLLAQRFDVKRLETIADPQPVTEQVAYTRLGPLGGGRQMFSVSNNGVLTYRRGVPSTAETVKLIWVDRNGKELGEAGQPGNYFGVAISPDEKRIAVHAHSGAGGDVWLVEPPRVTPLRLTFDSQDSSSPIWSPDGKRIAFVSNRSALFSIYQKPSDGTSNEELVFESQERVVPMSWSRDGQFLMFSLIDAKTNSDLWLVPLQGEKKLLPFVQSAFAETHGQISPDGKWCAYTSNEAVRMKSM